MNDEVDVLIILLHRSSLMTVSHKTSAMLRCNDGSIFVTCCVSCYIIEHILDYYMYQVDLKKKLHILIFFIKSRQAFLNILHIL